MYHTGPMTLVKNKNKIDKQPPQSYVQDCILGQRGMDVSPVPIIKSLEAAEVNHKRRQHIEKTNNIANKT
jgi:hypothetical protein